MDSWPMCFSMGNENYRCVSSAKSFTLGCCVGGVLKRCYFLLVDHCVKSVKIRSYFWSIFSCIWTEYGDLQSNRKYGPEITPHLETFHAVDVDIFIDFLHLKNNSKWQDSVCWHRSTNVFEKCFNTPVKLHMFIQN